jgi:hypothetical protein
MALIIRFRLVVEVVVGRLTGEWIMSGMGVGEVGVCFWQKKHRFCFWQKNIPFVFAIKNYPPIPDLAHKSPSSLKL